MTVKKPEQLPGLEDVSRLVPLRTLADINDVMANKIAYNNVEKTDNFVSYENDFLMDGQLKKTTALPKFYKNTNMIS